MVNLNIYFNLKIDYFKNFDYFNNNLNLGIKYFNLFKIEDYLIFETLNYSYYKNHFININFREFANY